MIARNLRLTDRPQVDLWIERLPGASPASFWRRVAEGFYRPIGLSDNGDGLDGLLAVSVDERGDGRELHLQLSTRPGFAKRNRDALRRLIERLAEQHACQRIVFESKRGGWKAVAESLGFSPDPIVRYSLEVPHVR